MKKFLVLVAAVCMAYTTAFFHLLEVFDAFLILLFTKFFRIITIIFIITGIIHTESYRFEGAI